MTITEARIRLKEYDALTFFDLVDAILCAFDAIEAIEDAPNLTTEEFMRRKVSGHPSTDECPYGECMICSARDCPYGDLLHYHHDGCPACIGVEDRIERSRREALDWAASRIDALDFHASAQLAEVIRHGPQPTKVTP